MIASIRGIVDELRDGGATIDVGGVGYNVSVTNECFGTLKTGSSCKLVIFEHIKEDAHDLYGFLDKANKALFTLLISVNGVGPKMALNIMNIGRSAEVRAAIAAGDTKYIQSASGVGKKVAERIIVDLKDKVGLQSSEDATGFLSTSDSLEDEAVQALAALGFTPLDAQQALSGIDPSKSTQERIKYALGNRGGH